MSKKNQQQFKDRYTAAELAQILGVTVETVQKRARAGKLPGLKNPVSGQWSFNHVTLVAAKVAPFHTETKVNRTGVIFVLDRSGSMQMLMGEARRSLRSQLDTLRAAQTPTNRYDVSVIHFGSNSVVSLDGCDVDRIHKTDEVLYPYQGGGTKMTDAIAQAISMADVQLSVDPEKAVLISIVTDGGENESEMEETELAGMISARMRTDRFTFAFAGPHGSEWYATSLGLPAGNVTKWDQTVFGVQTLGVTTNHALVNYTSNVRGRGITSSTSFYAQPVNSDPSQFAAKLDNKLGALDQSRFTVERVTAKDPLVIRKFCEKKFGTFPKGNVYYQLTESEKVQDYKKVVIQDTATGNFYAGQKSAMALLGIPNFTGTARIKPGSLGEFKVFVQSTSVNRKLVPETAVIRLL